MATFWDTIKAAGARAGEATKIAATRGKLNTDIMLIDREVTARKHKFGQDMYDYIAPLSESADFYAATDQLTEILRGPLINAQREIKALEVKRAQMKEEQAQQEITRASSFPTKAETFGEKLKNAGKSTYLAGGETKLKAQLAVVERQITNIKSTFGFQLYKTLVEAEDSRGYLPTDRSVRSMYDACRNDISGMEKRQQEKRDRLTELGGGGAAGATTDNAGGTTPGVSVNATYNAPNTSHQQGGFHHQGTPQNHDDDDLLL
mmetsp:Transcript_4062/g.11505  ORF Transcript_4062/g.11505 Transcript_4062/m.11505 type:complete len:262 (+) Transcript_4062:52-837(+)|eukprot:CAMPEP_0119557056 /NCGR_PEP_ID=MMETSP1352-20130426/8837_1 /TAXON_ID=265584 /ORGANISM="Stauroneis constricta, Strain CCMP1120" /LENGTH=261 /DNA_ID=CAMNT_0007604095 /DNA_START=140 /DNA_END=925 /DNA_ORIENTATION=+